MAAGEEIALATVPVKRAFQEDEQKENSLGKFREEGGFKLSLVCLLKEPTDN